MKKTLLLAVAALALAAPAVETFRIPFAAPNLVAPGGWGAKGGPKTEYVDMTVSGPFFSKIEIAEPGPHAIWVNYSVPSNQLANAAIRIVDDMTGETVHWTRYDFIHCLPGERLFDKSTRGPNGRKAKTDWFATDVTFERPGAYTFQLYAAGENVLRRSSLETKSVWVSSDPRLLADPKTGRHVPSYSLKGLLVPTNAPSLKVTMPEGFEPARHRPICTELNSGVADKNRRFFACLHQNGHVFGYGGCDAELGNLGFVGFAVGGANSVHLTCGAGAKAGGKTPEEVYEKNVKIVRDVLADPAKNGQVVQWDISWEGAASFYWGKTNVWPRYRGWLKGKYGSVAKLNAAWRTAYKSFDEVEPPESRAQVLGKDAEKDLGRRAQLRANFIDYRAACADWHAGEMGARAKAVLDTDPEHRRVTAAFSNLDLNSVTFSAWRASDFDVIIDNLVKAGATHFGYDAYASDDFIGMEIDEFSSFADDKLTINCSETSTHTPDPTLAVRSYWTGIGKGLGMWATFQHQEQGWNVEFPKFGNTDSRQTPRPKLAAFSDAVRAVHQIEDLYVASKKAYPAKPVAIYYSRTCNALQERGYGSIFDAEPDTVFHVYEMIRACGYPVTFICDRQLRDGSKRLDKMGALVFVDAKYVPADTVETVAAWVKRGGRVFVDGRTAIYGEHGYPQDGFLPHLGVKPVGGAFEEYDPDNLHTTEFVATDGKGLMFSGFGRLRAEPADPSVRIALRDPKGEPVCFVRTDGKGEWTYLAGFLGTIYGGSPDQYGWRDGHADVSHYRFVGDWLARTDATPVVDLSGADPHVTRALRFESPLVDKAGNAILNVENYSFRKTPAGMKVSWNLPKSMKKPQKLLFLRASTREAVDLPFVCADGRLSCELPPFGAYAAILSLSEAPSPTLSVKLEGLSVSSPASAELPVVGTNATFVAKVRVINATGDDLKKGTVTLRLPYGWCYDRETAEVPSLDDGESSDELAFRIHAPEWCVLPNVRPINFIYETKDGRKSMPTVQAVWWGEAGK